MNSSDPEFFATFVKALRDAHGAVNDYVETYGLDALAILANAVDDLGGFHSEVLLHQHELEDDALNRYNLFVPELINMARATKSYQTMCNKLIDVVAKFVPKIVDEVLANYSPPNASTN